MQRKWQNRTRIEMVDAERLEDRKLATVAGRKALQCSG